MWARTFFNSADLQRYFYDDEAMDQAGHDGLGLQLADDNRALVSQMHGNVDENDVSSILSNWNTQLEKSGKELEIADEAVAKTDHTLWFKRNQWPGYVKGCNLRHLSRSTRLPDRDEELLQRAVEVNIALIERCVKGLRTLDFEARRWL